MGQYPRLLIISNECLSNVTSNGRTLRNFLKGWPRDRIAQFCIRSNAPDYSVCDNYYYVSDRDALNAFIKGKRATGQMPRAKCGATQAVDTGGKNALTMLLRDLVWNSMRWYAALSVRKNCSLTIAEKITWMKCGRNGYQKMHSYDEFIKSQM